MAGNIRPSGDGYLVGTFSAAAAITRGQVLMFSDNGSVTPSTDARDQLPIGVALEDAASGEAVTVVRGYCLVMVQAALTVDNQRGAVIVATDGKVGAAGDNTSTNRYIVGHILADAAAAGDLVPCFVAPYYDNVDHTPA
jgi:predicted RecA/RadA family phage recombinase